MSDFASAVERARKAHGAAEQIETMLMGSPDDAGLQISFSGMRKMAEDAHEQVLRYAEMKKIEVCNYRMLPEAAEAYSLSHVSKSLLEYQHLFSQIYDANVHKPKTNLTYPKDVEYATEMQFGYTYAGSLGVVLLAPSERDFFEGKLDRSINDLFEIINIDSRRSVREIAQRLGNAVVKRLHDWSRANIDAGFATDVRWDRSDGRKLGEVVPRKKLENIVNYIVATSEKKTEPLTVNGVLFGGDLKSETFHFAVLNGDTYRGKLAKEFQRDTDMTLGRRYRAVIRETTSTVYALNKIEKSHELLALQHPRPLA